MGGLTHALTRTMSQSSRRFLRDVAASVLATGVASVAFSHLAHERAPHEAAGRNPGKFDERLSWRAEDVPTRQTTTYDTIAMFSLPLSAETAWSEAPVPAEAGAPAAPIALAKLDLGRSEPSRPPAARAVHGPQVDAGERPARLALAALPPVRPGNLVRTAEAACATDAATTSDPAAEPRPIRVLGWAVPGSDLLPSGPEALQRVASLGGKVASFGGALVDTVGLR